MRKDDQETQKAYFAAYQLSEEAQAMQPISQSHVPLAVGREQVKIRSSVQVLVNLRGCEGYYVEVSRMPFEIANCGQKRIKLAVV